MIDYISALEHPALQTEKPRRLSILGATGSIGRSALDVVRRSPELFVLQALAAGKNISLLAEQAREFRPPVLAISDTENVEGLRALLPADYQPEIVCGQKGFKQIAADDGTEVVLAAQVGAAGLGPAYAAAASGKVLCLANKEALVLGGHLFRTACRESGAVLLPIDSEHNALFQALRGHDPEDVSSVILTASGGPFLGRDKKFLQQVKPAQALRHPRWSMGAKISIDSATLMNKGLEILEAWHLFGLPAENIRVLVHPQSIVHSLVEYRDGSQLAQLGQPDMRIPLSYCLGFPRRLPLDLPRLHLAEAGQLDFFPPDTDNFPCLNLARSVLDLPSSAATVLNAANEIGVELFLQEQIGFLDIARVVEGALHNHQPFSLSSVDEIQALDTEIRCQIRLDIKKGHD